MVPSGKIRGNGHKQQHRKLQLNMRKHCFTVKVMEHWNRLLREAVEPPSLEMFNPCLDVMLYSVLQVTLLGQGNRLDLQ